MTRHCRACGDDISDNEIYCSACLYEATVDRPANEIRCPHCGGAGGDIWVEQDGSENGEKCDYCDGFGWVDEDCNCCENKSCKGECGCRRCYHDYQDFLSYE